MRRFIRNRDNEIVGIEEIREENEILNEISSLSKELSYVKRTIIRVQNKPINDVNKTMMSYLITKRDNLIDRIKYLYGIKSYRYGELFNFNVQVEELDMISYVPESKKELVKARNIGYGIYRNGRKKFDNKPYTLDPEYYK